jgi:hypothetical protein
MWLLRRLIGLVRRRPTGDNRREMKRMLFVLSLVAMTPLACFAQARTPVPLITPPPTQSDPLGGEVGIVTAISPQIITVKTEAANPMSFAIDKKAQFVDKKGKKVKQQQIKVGARVRVYYQGGEETRTANKIVLES